MGQHLSQTDKKLYDMLQGEIKREREGVELIPSENYVSRAVLDALGREFTDRSLKGIQVVAIMVGKSSPIRSKPKQLSEQKPFSAPIMQMSKL